MSTRSRRKSQSKNTRLKPTPTVTEYAIRPRVAARSSPNRRSPVSAGASSRLAVIGAGLSVRDWRSSAGVELNMAARPSGRQPGHGTRRVVDGLAPGQRVDLEVARPLAPADESGPAVEQRRLGAGV